MPSGLTKFKPNLAKKISSGINLNWHDGLLRSYEVSKVGDATLAAATLLVDLYLEPTHARNRTSFRIVLERVHSITARLDFDELRDNSFAGTISYGYFKRSSGKKGGRVLWLYLTDGIFEIHFETGTVCRA